MSEITRILNDVANGRANSAAQLLPAAYEELRQLAAARIARERPGQTLDATGLVHEAYLKLVDNQSFVLAGQKRWQQAARDWLRPKMSESF